MQSIPATFNTVGMVRLQIESSTKFFVSTCTGWVDSVFLYVGILSPAEFLHEKGLDADQVARSGRALALSDISIKFMQPLRSRETFTSRLRIVKLTAARIVFEQQLLKVERTTGAETLVATAEATAVVLDDNYRPVRVEKEMQEMLLSSAPDA